MLVAPSRDERVKLLMVSKPKRPRCFGSARDGTSFGPDPFMHYSGHPYVWSNSSRAHVFIHAMPLLMHLLMRSSMPCLLPCRLLIPLFIHPAYSYICSSMSSATTHVTAVQVAAIPHMCLIFVPPNCALQVQHLDQGIIYSFKATYRKWWLLVAAHPHAIEPDRH